MAKTISLEITSSLSQRRVESILEKEMHLSSSLISKMKRIEGAILLNGKMAKTIDVVNEKDVLTATIPENGNSVKESKIPLEILFEDSDIIAINKPPAMPVHPSKKHITDTLANGIKYYLGENGGIHIITRLDRDTSGVVLVAKNRLAAKILTEAMKCGNIKKEYIAAVNGCPKEKRGIIDKAIERDTGIKRKVSEVGKCAVTEYEVIRDDEISLLRLFPKTGRTHQLRVHLSSIGHPIFGDSMYGAPQEGERCRLHCRRLEFLHPESGEKTEIIAHIPEDMMKL